MRGSKIVIISEDAQLRRLMRMALGSNGYEVADAFPGEDDLAQVRTELADLVLIARKENALETCRSVRAGSDVPVIVVSLQNAPGDVVAALDAGADDFVAQPFRTEELLARIRAVMRRSVCAAGPAPVRLTLDGVVIDFASRRVTAHQEVRHLTPKEFELLRYLVSHAGKVVAHRTLLQAIWGPDYDGQVDYLRVFINQLRKKIELDPSRPKFILTEPWVGYRFAPPEPLLQARAS